MKLKPQKPTKTQLFLEVDSWDEHHDVVENDGIDQTYVGGFDVYDLAGCCGVNVITAFRMKPRGRTDDVAKLIDKEAVNKWRMGLLICTVQMRNKKIVAALSRNGWIQACTFNNPKTGNRLGLYYRNPRTKVKR